MLLLSSFDMPLAVKWSAWLLNTLLYDMYMEGGQGGGGSSHEFMNNQLIHNSQNQYLHFHNS